MPAAGHPAQLLTGLTLWFVWFSLVYGGAAIACAVAPPPASAGPWNWANGALLVLTLVFVAGFGAAAGRTARAAAGFRGDEPGMARRRFFASAGAVLYGVAAVATVVVALPLLVLAPCI